VTQARLIYLLLLAAIFAYVLAAYHGSSMSDGGGF